MKTVGEIIDALSDYDPDMPCGIQDLDGALLDIDSVSTTYALSTMAGFERNTSGKEVVVLA